jgi:hypothetical protein
MKFLNARLYGYSMFSPGIEITSGVVVILALRPFSFKEITSDSLHLYGKEIRDLL